MGNQNEIEVFFYVGKDEKKEAQLKSLIAQLGFINCSVQTSFKNVVPKNTIVFERDRYFHRLKQLGAVSVKNLEKKTSSKLVTPTPFSIPLKEFGNRSLTHSFFWCANKFAKTGLSIQDIHRLQLVFVSLRSQNIGSYQKFLQTAANLKSVKLDKEFKFEKFNSNKKINTKYLLSCLEDNTLFEELVASQKCTPKTFEKLCEAMLPKLNGNRVAMALICAHLSANEKLIEKVQKKFIEKLLSPHNLLLPNSNSSKKTHVVNTTTFVFLCLIAERNCKRPQLNDALESVGKKFHNLPLLPDFSYDKSAEALEIKLENNELDTDLFNKFFTVLEFPKGSEGYWLIDENIQRQNLHSLVNNIQNLLIELFSTKFPLYFSSPWPKGKKIALSVRFDVDRPITAEKADQICQIQMDTRLGSFGSWYFRPELESSWKIIPLLKKRLQEIGVHISNKKQIRKSLGFTCHSGIGSEYWQPNQRNLARIFETPYSEILHLRTFFPLIFYEKKKVNVLRNKILPQLFCSSHYPLEGGTEKSSPQYTKLGKDLERVLKKSEGHLILATHPDIDTSHLEKILEKVKQYDIWADTIVNVSKRYFQIREVGSISVKLGINDEIIFSSKNTLADLHIKEYFLDKVSSFDFDFPIENSSIAVARKR